MVHNFLPCCAQGQLFYGRLLSAEWTYGAPGKKGYTHIFPKGALRIQWLEDPGIIEIFDTYYLTYTAYDGINALGSLAVSTDLQNFERRGIIVPQVTYQNYTLAKPE